MNRCCYNLNLVCITLLLSTQFSSALPPLTRVQVLAISENGSTQKGLQSLSRRALLGSYYVGDGLGYNLDLTLQESGEYQCELHGCNRSSGGRTSGKWSIDKDGLHFKTDKADGMFKERPLKSLQVLMLKGQYVFMDEKSMDYFRKYGADTYCCFHKDKAREVLEQHSKKMFDNRVSEAVEKLKKADK